MVPGNYRNYAGNDYRYFSACCTFHPDGNARTALEVIMRMGVVLYELVGENDYFDAAGVGVKRNGFPAELRELGDDANKWRETIDNALFVAIVTYGDKPTGGDLSAGGQRIFDLLKKELGVTYGWFSVTEFNRVNSDYLAKIDIYQPLVDIWETQISSKPWLTQALARFNAGTSHLSAIATAIKLAPKMPYWQYADESEIEFFLAGLDFINKRPLALHPANKTDQKKLERYRLAAVSDMFMIAIMLLKAAGIRTWDNYQNRAKKTNLGLISAAELENAIDKWVRDQARGALKKASKYQEEEFYSLFDRPARKLITKFGKSTRTQVA